ncbi:transcription repressor OFP15-like [Impatiens glandulifera]|uniref:transcription repressor OFP15-like n=1 Tax=Impatiens glandulifera TaxID=253017 RepID=UPI001FB077CD|nr:transcription repressor OFP15-like [Impatiens glandulifera]
MGKKLKLIPFLFRTISSSDPPPSWTWPSCTNQPKTLSFRAGADILKTANSVFSVEESSSGDDEKAVLRGLMAKDRLFFEPGQTSSILESPPLPPKQRKKKKEASPEMAQTEEMDSLDPVMDFRRSMEEMVEAHGMKYWDGLEELLGWYLCVNEKSNHGYIVAAFVDLIIGICLSEEELSESLSLSFSSLLTRSEEGDDHHHHKVLHNNSMSTSISSHSPTSALSFSSSSTSSCSILPSSLQALLKADDDQDKIQNS